MTALDPIVFLPNAVTKPIAICWTVLPQSIAEHSTAVVGTVCLPNGDFYVDIHARIGNDGSRVNGAE